MTRLIFILLSLTLVFNQCKKTPEKPTYYLNQEFKDFTIFNTGSKWIYQLENTLQKDTVIQIKKEITIADPQNISYKWEQVVMHARSSYFNDTLMFWGDAAPPDYFTTAYLRMFYLKSFNSFIVSYFTSDSIPRTVEIYGGMKTTYAEKRANIKINNTTFTDVKIFEVLHNSGNTSLPRKIFFSKNAGIIRKELMNGQVWDLIDYQVTQ